MARRANRHGLCPACTLADLDLAPGQRFCAMVKSVAILS
jgi:hypothetical protein